MPIPEFSFRSAEDRFRLLVNTLGKDSLRKKGILDEWSQVLLPGFHREQRNMMRRFRDKQKVWDPPEAQCYLWFKGCYV